MVDAPTGTAAPGDSVKDELTEHAKEVVQQSIESDRSGSTTTPAKRVAFNGYDNQWREEVGAVREEVPDEPTPKPSTSTATTEPIVPPQEGLRRRNSWKTAGQDFDDDVADEDLGQSGM